VKSKNQNGFNPNQFSLSLLLKPYPFRLRAGDVIRTSGKLCRVIRVTECAAVVLMNRPVRRFETRFRGPVTFQSAPALFRISPQAECEILNRKTK
jgi:hypothetical protein